MFETIPKSWRPLAVLGVPWSVFLVACFGLWPLAKKTNALQQQIRLQRRDLQAARSELQGLSSRAQSGNTLAAATLAEALDELARRAQEGNVLLRSFRSEALEPPAEHPYSRLTAHMEVEATYDHLGRFLGSLSAMLHCRLAVKSIKVVRDAALLPTIRARIRMDIYIVEKA